MIRETHENTRITYNKIAGIYHERFKNELSEKPFDRKYLDKFAEYFSAGSLLVDAGCGPSAHYGRYLSGKGYSVIGIDISEECIRIASEYNPGMAFICSDNLDWHPEEGSIDGIIACYSIIYSPKAEIDQLFKVFYNSLTENGKLLVVVKKGGFEGYQEEVLGVSVHSYFAEYNEIELQQIVTRNGFTVDELLTRAPYRGEIKNERIYCLCSRQ